MKIIHVLVVVTILMWSCKGKPLEVGIEVDELVNFKPTIVLMHPTVNNLKTFKALAEQGVFPLPSDARVLGVYHAKGAYDYNLSKEYLAVLADKRYKLLAASGELNPQNIYKRNECSESFTSIFENSKGVVFFGGPDMPPSTYGEPTNLLTEITDAHRHYLELSMQFHLLGGYQNTFFVPLMEQNKEYGVLGICLGMQTMNVATGGTMIQDIPNELYSLSTVEGVLALDPNMQHRNYHSNYGTDNSLIWGHLHQIKFDKGSLMDTLNSFAQHLPYIWSSHHQALSKLGKGIVPIAWSMDGKIVEAIKHTKYPNVLGVQFHPEVPSIFDMEKKLNRLPFEENPKSYIELYPKEQGEDFHRAIWKRVGEWYGKVN